MRSEAHGKYVVESSESRQRKELIQSVRERLHALGFSEFDVTPRMGIRGPVIAAWFRPQTGNTLEIEGSDPVMVLTEIMEVAEALAKKRSSLSYFADPVRPDMPSMAAQARAQWEVIEKATCKQYGPSPLPKTMGAWPTPMTPEQQANMTQAQAAVPAAELCEACRRGMHDQCGAQVKAANSPCSCEQCWGEGGSEKWYTKVCKVVEPPKQGVGRTKRSAEFVFIDEPAKSRVQVETKPVDYQTEFRDVVASVVEGVVAHKLDEELKRPLLNPFDRDARRTPLS